MRAARTSDLTAVTRARAAGSGTSAAPPTQVLPVRWRTRAAELRDWAGADGAARAWECAATELEAALAQQADAELTLEDASTVSGYHPDSLRRLVHERKLCAVRRGRRLFFRAGDLPRKAPEPATVDGPQLVGYDPVADARMVAGQRREDE